jgi:hypothetical protein
MKPACLALFAAITLTSAVMAEDNWHQSEYGPADTHGAMNNLSPKDTVKAAKLVKTGKTYALGVITSRESPAYPGRHSLRGIRLWNL